MPRSCALPLWVVLGLCLSSWTQGQAGRVIVLGVDGFDHQVCKAMMAAGELPHLSALAKEGGFFPLLPSNPAQSPTSWASLATGRSPGGTRIFGFLRRRFDDQGAMVPEIALAEREPKVIVSWKLKWILILGGLLVSLVPVIVRRTRRGAIVSLTLGVLLGGGLAWFFDQVPPQVQIPHNRLEGDPFWVALDREGVPAVSLFAPCSFPAPPLERGRLLSGLGVPDLLGTSGRVAVFSDAVIPKTRRSTQMGGRLVPLHKVGSAFSAELLGPADPRAPSEGPVRKTLHLSAASNGELRLSIDGHGVDLRLGEFSPFIPLNFQMGAFVSIHGLVRFRLLQGLPHPSLYQEPIQFDPSWPHPLAAIASPARFAVELAEDGPFETLGWATATNPFQDGLIDEKAFSDDAIGVFRRRRAMVLKELKRGGFRLFFALLSTPDRIQHMFWRLRDERHPAHRPLRSSEADPIAAAYRRIDELVGEIRSKHLGEKDLLLVVSDHGFSSFRRAVNLNRWLVEEGYLVGKDSPGERSLESGIGRPVFTGIDWSKTRAYSLGLGRIWLNLKGREPGGTVAPGDAEALAREIAARLLALDDRGQKVVHSVALSSEIYRGSYRGEASDLIVGFERGYRVSWNSCLGGFDDAVIFDNLSRWSGDHCSVDPSLVPGVLFSNRSLEKGEAARVVDIYPTIRQFLGLEAASGLDGVSLR